jgi:hypothetical protein
VDTWLLLFAERQILDRKQDHSATMQSGKAELQKRNQVVCDEKLATILRRMTAEKSQTICKEKDRCMALGPPIHLKWDGALGTRVPRCIIVNETCRNTAQQNFPDKCDGCDAHFSLQHALGCKKGGLVMFRHNEIGDELANLASRACTPSPARNEPLASFHGRANENVKTSPNKTANQNINEEAATGEDERGDLLIRRFWTACANCILDVCVTDMDAKSDCKWTPFTVLESQERENNE